MLGGRNFTPIKGNLAIKEKVQGHCNVHYPGVKKPPVSSFSWPGETSQSDKTRQKPTHKNLPSNPCFKVRFPEHPQVTSDDFLLKTSNCQIGTQA
jgi:hypothetical protein